MQAVAGQMLTFFAELGCQFPQFPFIAHSRGWSAEDMENNELHVRNSKFLHDGAAALVQRSADMARVMVESTLGEGALVRGGRKGHQLDTAKEPDHVGGAPDIFRALVADPVSAADRVHRELDHPHGPAVAP